MDSNRSPERVYLNLLISGVYMDFNRSSCVLTWTHGKSIIKSIQILVHSTCTPCKLHGGSMEFSGSPCGVHINVWGSVMSSKEEGSE